MLARDDNWRDVNQVNFRCSVEHCTSGISILSQRRRDIEVKSGQAEHDRYIQILVGPRVEPHMSSLGPQRELDIKLAVSAVSRGPEWASAFGDK